MISGSGDSLESNCNELVHFDEKEDIFSGTPSKEEYNYPDVYPAAFNEKTLLFYAGNTLANDMRSQFVLRLAAMYRQEKLTIVEENEKACRKKRKGGERRSRRESFRKNKISPRQDDKTSDTYNASSTSSTFDIP